MSEPTSNEEEVRTAEALIRDLERVRGARCPDCGAAVCSHQTLMNLTLGLNASPRCLRCLAAVLERDPVELRDQLAEHLQLRECHRLAWGWASQSEGSGAEPIPQCLRAFGA